MKNFVAQGRSLALAAPYDRLSGQGALVGSIFGIAATDVLSGAVATFELEGVFTHAKTSAQAWTVGTPLYWDDTNKVVTSTSTSNKLIGVAVAAAANPSATGTIRLNGAFIS